MIEIAPSILAANPLEFGKEALRMQEIGVDLLHVDIMDGVFVPNISFGPSIAKALYQTVNIPLDVHLMITDPSKYLEVFHDSGAAILTIHAEIGHDLAPILKQIRALGMRSGLALKPHTTVDAVAELLPLVDQITVMTVEPGFGGQPFCEDAAHNISDLRAAGYQGHIIVDGGVSLSNASRLAELGADRLVMGTALYKSSDPRSIVEAVHAMNCPYTVKP